MILFDKINIKIVQSSPFSPIYGKLPYFSLNCHFYVFRKMYRIIFSRNNTRRFYQKRVTFWNFRNRSSHSNNCFRFLELFLIVNQSCSVRLSVWLMFFCTFLFQNSLITSVYSIITYLICFFFILFGSSVISVEIQTGIITTFYC